MTWSVLWSAVCRVLGLVLVLGVMCTGCLEQNAPPTQQSHAEAQAQQSAPAMLLYRRDDPTCASATDQDGDDGDDVLAQVAALLKDIEAQDESNLLELRATPVLAQGECERRITRSQARSLYGSQPQTEQACGARNRVWVCEDQRGLWVVSNPGDPSETIAHVRVSAADVSFTAVHGLGNASLQPAPVIAGFIRSPEATDIHWAVRQTELCLINVGNRTIWVDSFNDVPKNTTIFDGAGDLFFPRPVPAPPEGAEERASVVVMQRVQFRRPLVSDEAAAVRRNNVKNFCEKSFFVPTKVGEQSGMGLVAIDFQPLHSDESVRSVCAGVESKRSW